MNREDIIRMARESGFKVDWQHADVAEIKAKRYEYFAALVAAAERDRMCQQFNIPKELAHEKATGNEAD